MEKYNVYKDKYGECSFIGIVLHGKEYCIKIEYTKPYENTYIKYCKPNWHGTADEAQQFLDSLAKEIGYILLYSHVHIDKG